MGGVPPRREHDIAGADGLLRTRSADEETEELPDHAGTKTGRAVLEILQKRRVDLTDEDERVMRKVVDRIHAERRDDLEPTAGQENWRHG